MSGQVTHAEDNFDEAWYVAAVNGYYAATERPQAGGLAGKVVPEWAIDRETGRFLYDLVRRERPALSIEIGLCQGASALHLAAAHAVNGSGLHLAFDPFQRAYFADHGRIVLTDLGLDPWFRHIAERSDRALPMLVAAGLRPEFVFIDGDHRFDAVFNDFYWADKLVPDGGYIVLDEAGYDCPTARVNAFISTNLPNYVRLNGPTRLYVLQKTGQDRRDFGDHVPF